MGKGTNLSLNGKATGRNFFRTFQKLDIRSPVRRLADITAWHLPPEKTDKWWWPVIGAYWPPGAPREETLDAFISAFGVLGFSLCENGDLEPDFEKVAIYVDQNNQPTHMARQVATGFWVSKCGVLEDIKHERLEALESVGNRGYGRVHQYLKRAYR
jgi:hypothetical protein